MPRTTTRTPSAVPALLLGAAGVLVGSQLVHDLVDRRLLTAESIFHSPLAAIGAVLGTVMAGILLWDLFGSRRSR
ncbi:MAG TPA: hypothetical protein VFM53_09145 [Anaeromyxobacteraceae bacterium]|nr:hypothetical protein [Anaeromyxobacteraceae bacterium]